MSPLQAAFLPIWIESKMLPLHLGCRRTLTNALHVLMPGNYSGPPLTPLYRGTNWRERHRRIYGFSWTTDVAIARPFAEHWVRPLPAPYDNLFGGGAVLRTLAPRDAILLIRQPEDYYDEGEVVVDPFLLAKLRLSSAHRRSGVFD